MYPSIASAQIRSLASLDRCCGSSLRLVGRLVGRLEVHVVIFFLVHFIVVDLVGGLLIVNGLATGASSTLNDVVRRNRFEVVVVVVIIV